MNFEFPILYYEGNMIYTWEKTVWPYYEFKGFNYDHLSIEQKEILLTDLQSFFWQMNTPIHLIITTDLQSIEEKNTAAKENITGPLKEAAYAHLDNTTAYLKNMLGEEGTEYRFFIGVQIPKLEQLKTNKSIKKKIKFYLRFLKERFKEFINHFYQTVGLDVPEVLEEDLVRYEKAKKRLAKKINQKIQVEPINEETIQWLIRRNWYRGIGRPPISKREPEYDAEVKERKDGIVIVRRPVYKDVIRLTEGLIHEKSRSLDVKQMIGGEEKTGHTAFLTASEFPYEMDFPNNEWLYAIQDLDFPVDVSIRINTIENRRALAKIRTKQKELEDQILHAEESGKYPSKIVVSGFEEAKNLEAFLQKSRLPLLETSIVFAISSSDEEMLKMRLDAIKDHYEDRLIRLEQPFGDQFLLFNEFLPGAQRYVTDYIHYMEPTMLAGAMYGATKKLGDSEGFFIGETGLLRQPVRIWPAKAAQGEEGTSTNAISATFTGSLGGGKSFAANLITYTAVLNGAKAFVVCPKGERGEWGSKLHALQGHINIITLTTDEKHRGRLDPFMIHNNDIKAAESLALEVLTYLTGIRTNDSKRFPVLRQAIGRVANEEIPCLNKVVDELLNSDNEIAQLIGGHVESFKDLSFGHLLFGDGVDRGSLNVDTAMTVLQIQDLELPEPSKLMEEYTLIEMLSTAMMLPVSSFALKFVHGDNSQFKVVLLDEAWSLLQTSQGRNLVKRLVREGRRMNSAIYLVTQNADDLLDEKIKSNIGMKFAFRSTDPTEVENILKYFNLENTLENARMLAKLKNGTCLFQDLYGRVGVLKVNAMFEDLFDAFDTRPPEKRRERGVVHS